MKAAYNYPPSVPDVVVTMSADEAQILAGYLRDTNADESGTLGGLRRELDSLGVSPRYHGWKVQIQSRNTAA